MDMRQSAEKRAGTPPSTCDCERRGNRRRAAADFASLGKQFVEQKRGRDSSARGGGPDRQWVSDALVQSARNLENAAAEGSRAETSLLRRDTGRFLVRSFLLFLLWQVGMSFDWNVPAHGLNGAFACAVAASVLVVLNHFSKGAGLLGFLLGGDNRFSTSRAVVGVWAVCAMASCLSVLFSVWRDPGRMLRDESLWIAHLPVFICAATACATYLLIATVTRRKIRKGRLQKVPALAPSAKDLVADDDGRIDWLDLQYLGVNTAVVLIALGSGTRTSGGVATTAVAALAVGGAAALYIAAKCLQRNGPRIDAIVPVRDPGVPDGTIFPGDDLEIIGDGFVPPGSASPHALARLFVRIGNFYVRVRLVPGPNGIQSPTGNRLVISVPTDAVPGDAEIQVLAASGQASAPYPLRLGA